MIFRNRVQKRKEKDFNQEINLAVGLELERFSTAMAEHLRSLPELKDISKRKINRDFARQNKQQQAGSSAEVKHRARVNASRILNGESGKIELTDNVGEVNHQKYDHVEVDRFRQPFRNRDGNLTRGSQHKVFSKIESYDKLYGREFAHYEGTPIDVPVDQYEKITTRWNKQIQALEQQEAQLRERRKPELANVKREKIKRIKDTKARLRKSTVSSHDALEAREHYIRSTVKDTLGISHQSGVEAAKIGTSIGAGISGIQNSISLFKGDKDVGEAIRDIVKDSGKATVKSYASGAVSSIVGGALNASNKQVLLNLSKRNGPAAIASTGAILAKNVTKLFSGKITVTEFSESISREGMTLASSITGSNLGAVMGTAILPGFGTVVGGLVGGMVASMVSSSLYHELKKTLHDTMVSEERRQIMEQICEKLVKEEQNYREKMIRIFDEFYDQKDMQIREGLTNVLNAIQRGESIQAGLEVIGRAFEKDLAFQSTNDLKQHLVSGKTFKL